MTLSTQMDRPPLWKRALIIAGSILGFGMVLVTLDVLLEMPKSLRVVVQWLQIIAVLGCGVSIGVAFGAFISLDDQHTDTAKAFFVMLGFIIASGLGMIGTFTFLVNFYFLIGGKP